MLCLQIHSLDCSFPVSCIEAILAWSCLILFDPMVCSLPSSSVHGIFRQAYWSELQFPSPGDLPIPGIKCGSPALQTLSHQGSPYMYSIVRTVNQDLQYTQVCQPNCSVYVQYNLLYFTNSILSKVI